MYPPLKLFNFLEDPMVFVDTHKDINIGLMVKNLFNTKMEGEEFLSLLQVCLITL